MNFRKFGMDDLEIIKIIVTLLIIFLRDDILRFIDFQKQFFLFGEGEKKRLKVHVRRLFR
jgi:hypothetical protein